MSTWKQRECKERVVVDEDGQLVAECKTKEHASQIVLEHNAHEALLAALRGMIADDMTEAQETLDMGPGGTSYELEAEELIEDRVAGAVQAIALAEETK